MADNGSKKTPINVDALKQAGGQPDESFDLLTGKNYTPPLQILQNRTRLLSAFSIDATIGKFDPERITMRQRRQMRRDPMIKLGLHYRKVSLLNAPWHIECDDPAIAAFVTEAIKPVYNQLMVQLLTALEFGYAVVVKQYQREVPDWTYEDDSGMISVWPNQDIPAVTLKRFQALPPEGAQVIFTDDGEDYAGFRHSTLVDSNNNPLVVPASHGIWFANEFDESFGDWFGYPLTGYAFRYWWSYWYNWLMGDRHFETHADPPLMVDYPQGFSADPDNPGTTIDNATLALRVGENLRQGATIAMPSEYYEQESDLRPVRGARKWDAKFLTGGENLKAYLEKFEYLDVMKLRALMVPEQALIEGAKGTGSKNVAETYGDAFAESQAILMNNCDEVWNLQIIPDLVKQNFKDPPRCLKITEGFRDEDMGLANDLLKIIASNAPWALPLDVRKMVQDKKLPTIKPGAKPQIPMVVNGQPVEGAGGSAATGGARGGDANRSKGKGISDNAGVSDSKKLNQKIGTPEGGAVPSPGPGEDNVNY